MLSSNKEVWTYDYTEVVHTHTHTHIHTHHTHNVHTQNYNFLPQSLALESPFNQFALSQASIIGVFFLLSSGMITVSSKKIKQLGFAFYNFVPTPVFVNYSSNTGEGLIKLVTWMSGGCVEKWHIPSVQLWGRLKKYTMTTR